MLKVISLIGLGLGLRIGGTRPKPKPKPKESQHIGTSKTYSKRLIDGFLRLGGGYVWLDRICGTVATF